MPQATAIRPLTKVGIRAPPLRRTAPPRRGSICVGHERRSHSQTECRTRTSRPRLSQLVNLVGSFDDDPEAGISHREPGLTPRRPIKLAAVESEK